MQTRRSPRAKSPWHWHRNRGLPTCQRNRWTSALLEPETAALTALFCRPARGPAQRPPTAQRAARFVRPLRTPPPAGDGAPSPAGGGVRRGRTKRAALWAVGGRCAGPRAGRQKRAVSAAVSGSNRAEVQRFRWQVGKPLLRCQCHGDFALGLRRVCIFPIAPVPRSLRSRAALVGRLLLLGSRRLHAASGSLQGGNLQGGGGLRSAVAGRCLALAAAAEAPPPCQQTRLFAHFGVGVIRLPWGRRPVQFHQLTHVHGRLAHTLRRAQPLQLVVLIVSARVPHSPEEFAVLPIVGALSEVQFPGQLQVNSEGVREPTAQLNEICGLLFLANLPVLFLFGLRV
mmetsp:Transcript_140425/g.365105  ORF Transcript_140425/g.365105 Transcript_140425/m.365105 type:complete len:342 (+) Transcript_140425:1397-2422(+)